MLAIVIFTGSSAGANDFIDDAPLGLLEPGCLRLRGNCFPDVAVQESRMKWINAVFYRLQPVASAEPLHDGMPLPLRGEKMEPGQKRPRLRAHVGKYETAK